MPPSADRDNNPLARLQGAAHIIHTLNVGDDLLERAVRLHTLSEGPHRVATDDRLCDGRTIVRVRLNRQTKGTGTNREDERGKHAGEQTATRGLSPTTRSSRRTQVRGIINALSLNTTTCRGGRRDVTNGRERRFLHDAKRGAARRERDGNLPHNGNTHENLQKP